MSGDRIIGCDPGFALERLVRDCRRLLEIHAQIDAGRLEELHQPMRDAQARLDRAQQALRRLHEAEPRP